jgi:hypothetical protein
VVLGVWLVVLGPAAARAEADWFASVYTPGGVEVRSDARLFALYALLNRAGYDRGPLRREHPVPAYRYPPARVRIREALATADATVVERAEAFFDEHPVPLERYLAWALRSGEGVASGSPEATLGALLDRAEARWPLASLRAENFGAYREAMRAWLPVLDGPLGKARQLLRIGEGGPGVQVVVDLLEAEGVVRGLRVGREVLVVVGPSEQPDVEAVVREYTRWVVSERVAERMKGRWPQGSTLWRQAQALGVGEDSPEAYAVALLARALALRVVEAPGEDYEAATRKGYFGVRELARSFDDVRPVDDWALEALARVEPGRPPRK